MIFLAKMHVELNPVGTGAEIDVGRVNVRPCIRTIPQDIQARSTDHVEKRGLKRIDQIQTFEAGTGVQLSDSLVQIRAEAVEFPE